MKKLVLLSAIVLGSVAYNNKANAQISIHLGFNVPVRHVYVPAQPPVETVYNDDYDNSDDYYYLPDVEAYYSIPNHCYYYNDGNTWVSAAYLPGAYRNYDWRNARRFEIRGRRPYMQHDIYRSKWGGNDNRGNWGRRDDNFAGRGFSNGSGGFNRDNRGGGSYAPRDYRNGYSQPNFGGRNGGNYNNGQQPQNNGGNRGRGGWDGQSAGGNGYGQPNQNGGGNQPQQPGQNSGRGNWGGGQQQQPSQGNGGGSQPNQNGGGGYNRGNGGGNAQPSNQNGGGHDRGNNNGGGQVAQNNMRSNIRMNEAMRPARF